MNGGFPFYQVRITATLGSAAPRPGGSFMDIRVNVDVKVDVAKIIRASAWRFAAMFYLIA